MELKELTDRTTQLLNITDPSEMGQALLEACNDKEKLDEINSMWEGDKTKDWMQMIYQYYLADRQEKKQDYTPSTLAELMGRLAGNAEEIVDMCAGSGALIIQKWNHNHDARFTAYEIDDQVIPFLIFNMVIRNIDCKVYQADVLSDSEPLRSWHIRKGEIYGRISNI